MTFTTPTLTQSKAQKRKKRGLSSSSATTLVRWSRCYRLLRTRRVFTHLKSSCLPKTQAWAKTAKTAKPADRQLRPAFLHLQQRTYALIKAPHLFCGARIGVRTASHTGNFTQCGPGKSNLHRQALRGVSLAIYRTQAHHKDARTAVGGSFGGFDGVTARNARAVAGQNDCGRRVRAGRYGSDLIGRRLFLVVQAVALRFVDIV